MDLGCIINIFFLDGGPCFIRAEATSFLSFTLFGSMCVALGLLLLNSINWPRLWDGGGVNGRCCVFKGQN